MSLCYNKQVTILSNTNKIFISEIATLHEILFLLQWLEKTNLAEKLDSQTGELDLQRGRANTTCKRVSFVCKVTRWSKLQHIYSCPNVQEILRRAWTSILSGQLTAWCVPKLHRSHSCNLRGTLIKQIGGGSGEGVEVSLFEWARSWGRVENESLANEKDAEREKFSKVVPYSTNISNENIQRQADGIINWPI